MVQKYKTQEVFSFLAQSVHPFDCSLVILILKAQVLQSNKETLAALTAKYKTKEVFPYLAQSVLLFFVIWLYLFERHKFYREIRIHLLHLVQTTKLKR